MRFKPLLFPLLLLMLPGDIARTTPAPDERLPFSDFIMTDGALTVFAQGDYVEPYTAVKALIIAHRLGVDVHAPAEAFADWILPFQQANGPFPRICRSGGNRWLACGPTDADDSLAVLWCALSSEVLPEKRALDASCQRALGNLAALWEPQKQTFRAMFGGAASYFADNVEVMMFLQSLRTDREAFTRHVAMLAKLPTQQRMQEALQRNYGYAPDLRLEPKDASLPPTPYAFYPYAVAPIYPMIYDLRTGAERQHDWRRWKYRYGKQWLAGGVDHFPWGLIAWAAYKAGDQTSAGAWLNHSAQWKRDGRWNIIEEGVQLGLSKVLTVR